MWRRRWRCRWKATTWWWIFRDWLRFHREPGSYLVSAFPISHPNRTCRRHGKIDAIDPYATSEGAYSVNRSCYIDRRLTPPEGSADETTRVYCCPWWRHVVATGIACPTNGEGLSNRDTGNRIGGTERRQ